VKPIRTLRVDTPLQSRPVSIYLAGAIRDGCPQDIEWREEVIEAIGDKAVLMNPLGGKHYSPQTKAWTFAGGRTPTPRSIVHHDLWCVDRADIVLANLESLADGYPMIGTMMELGRATATGALLYVIIKPGQQGLANKMFRLHPFIEDLASGVFESVDDAIDFLHCHLPVLDGRGPRISNLTYGSKQT
jgi:nucleoside 2-deoxyribosyltransferase